MTSDPKPPAPPDATTTTDAPTRLDRDGLLAMAERWHSTGGRPPNEVENERRKCARELERYVRRNSPPARPSSEPGERARALEEAARAVVESAFQHTSFDVWTVPDGILMRLAMAVDALASAPASSPGDEQGQAERIFDVLLLKEAMLAAAEADLRDAHEGDLHILKRRCTVCGEVFYTPHAEHDICRKHAYVGPLSGRADGKGTP